MQGSSAPAGWKLSLVIPAYNEEAGIAAAVVEADDTLARIAADYEVLVIDDGSRDGTFAAASIAAQDRPNVRVIRHEKNRGYGAALRTGFEAARFDRVAFTDADCQFDLNDLARLAPRTDEAPIIAGIRIDRKDPWRRRFLSRGYNRIVRTLLGTRVRDCDCALKVFRKDALSHLLPNSTNFFVNTEMLARARQNDFNVIEMGVTHRPRLRGQSTVSMTDVPKTLATLLPFWWSRVMFARSAGSDRGGWLGFGLVMLMAALLLFCRLRTPLLEPEEARYAEIPRQMLAQDRWLVPTLNGQPYFDKPPLMYWAVMGAYSAFGVHDWAARLVPGLAAWLTVAVGYFWSRQMAGARAALIGSLLLVLCPGFIYYGRMLTMNVLLGLFVTATLALGHAAMLAARGSRWLWLAAGVCAGLGMMTKGPVALALTIPPLLVLSRLDLRLARPRFSDAVAFLAGVMAAAAPWYLSVMILYPEFAGTFFWFHNVVRFVQPFDHQAPIWEYVPIMVLGIAPWLLLLVPLVRDLFSHGRSSAERRPGALGAFLLAFGWMALFFSLAGSKRPVYLVPLFPPLALAVGTYAAAALPWERFANAWALFTGHRDRLAYWVTVGVLTGMIALGTGAWAAGMREPGRAVALVGIAGLALAAFTSLAAARRTSWSIAVAAGFLAMFGGIHDLLPEYARRFSMRHNIQMHAWQAREKNVPIVCYPHRFESIGFYSGRTDAMAFDRTRRREMFDSLHDRSRTLVFVQTKQLREFMSDIPIGLEFIPRNRDGLVVVGEVRKRKEARPWLVVER